MILNNFFKNNIKKIIISFFLFFAVFLIFFTSIDENAKVLIEDSFSQAIIVFGSSKALNAAISLAQGTQIDLPFLTLAIGEVLDPVNDLVEQFSFVMLLSLISLGLQKILLNLVNNSMYDFLLMFSIFGVFLWSFIRFKVNENLRKVFFKFVILILFLKFSIPLVSYLNELTYQNFVKQNYNIEKLNDEILVVKDNISKITQDSIDEKQEKSLFKKISEKFDSDYYKQKIKQYEQSVDKSSEYIISLIIVFIFQTLVLPLCFLFILYIFIKNIIFFK